MPNRMLQLMRSLDLFADVAPADLAGIARLLKEQKFSDDEVIFAQGSAGDGLYILLSGRVRVATTDVMGRKRVLAFYGPGEFFGEMALLTGALRSATASASGEVRCLHLRKDDFDVLVATSVGVMRGMLRVMIERQVAMNTRINQESGVEGGVRGQVTVVFSAQGGAGQTVLATNVAVALAQITPDRVLILDLDLLFGHVAMLLDVVPRSALSAVTPAAIRSLDKDSLAFYLTTHGPSSLRLLVGTVRPEESELVTADHVRSIIELLRTHFVHVVIDAGSRFSEPCLAALELADQVLVVSTPESWATHRVRESQRVLRELLAVPAERIRFVQNQPSPYSHQSLADLSASLSTERVVEIPFGGEDVSKAALNGLPIVMSRSGNATSKAIAHLARDLDRSGRELLALSV